LGSVTIALFTQPCPTRTADLPPSACIAPTRIGTRECPLAIARCLGSIGAETR
jgi:hypothetical protein